MNDDSRRLPRRPPDDPLAELARLIGQEDPFADFAAGRPVRLRVRDEPLPAIPSVRRMPRHQGQVVSEVPPYPDPPGRRPDTVGKRILPREDPPEDRFQSYIRRREEEAEHLEHMLYYIDTAPPSKRALCLGLVMAKVMPKELEGPQKEIPWTAFYKLLRDAEERTGKTRWGKERRANRIRAFRTAKFNDGSVQIEGTACYEPWHPSIEF